MLKNLNEDNFKIYLKSKEIQLQNPLTENKLNEFMRYKYINEEEKKECESMHKLIKEFNEQAMDMLYSQNQNNISKDAGIVGAPEYLVI